MVILDKFQYKKIGARALQFQNWKIIKNKKAKLKKKSKNLPVLWNNEEKSKLKKCKL